ncbi:molybdopterin molybdotransferase [Psychromicrobium silvestre]|uniref:Molybdopterin molybdenumtransferase n=1 Tax=Psychromicrobium silvestre TaxID=1645614 RepID=A0A7Y9LVM0_9MICC|nr:molybdopterin molybdotransferase MoeA [Psychromicrobium silvestre]NYE96360.1 molybdopterin molybdotransferase [Psychromicrobium silvestre]
MPEIRLKHDWLEARQLAFEAAASLPDEQIPLAAAGGRTLASEVRALQDLPHFDSAAMDGWAVSGSAPWIFAPPGERLYPGQASPILTGGVLPPGAKAVLRSESGEETVDGEGLAVLGLSTTAAPGEPKAGQHIRRRAQEAGAGEVLLEAGSILNPARLALGALAGVDELTVGGKPKVRLLLTGNEIIETGLPEPGQVRDVFGPQLAWTVEMLGGVVTGQQRLSDELPATVAALSEDDGQLLISTGGTGHSNADYLHRALAEIGAELLVDGVSMRPGAPSFLAALPELGSGPRFLVGLPGNPLAAFIGLLTLAQPLLAGLNGEALPEIGQLACGVAFEPLAGRTRLMPYRELYGLASPVSKVEAAMLRGLVQAEGIMVVPPHGVRMGESVQVLPLPWSTP